jgi:diaminopimelate decarboxylase
VSDPAPLLGAYQQVVRLANEFRDHGAPIEYVDFGGGFGISYSGRYAPLEIEKFAAALSEIVKGSNYTLIVEPGKYLIAEAGVLLTKILYTKQSLSRKFLVCDAGMNDLIRPALYDAYHKIDVVSQQLNPLTPLQVVDVVGPICESGCYLAQERELPEGQPGDLLAIRDAGAYGFSMASHYNTRPLPAEVLISSEGTDRLIRERESYDDLLRAELPFLAE